MTGSAGDPGSPVALVRRRLRAVSIAGANCARAAINATTQRGLGPGGSQEASTVTRRWRRCGRRFGTRVRWRPGARLRVDLLGRATRASDIRRGRYLLSPTAHEGYPARGDVSAERQSAGRRRALFGAGPGPRRSPRPAVTPERATGSSGCQPHDDHGYRSESNEGGRGKAAETDGADVAHDGREALVRGSPGGGLRSLV